MSASTDPEHCFVTTIVVWILFLVQVPSRRALLRQSMKRGRIMWVRVETYCFLVFDNRVGILAVVIVDRGIEVVNVVADVVQKFGCRSFRAQAWQALCIT